MTLPPATGRLCTVLQADVEVTVELERRKSRFLTVMRRVTSTDQAQMIVETLRAQHHRAAHHGSAWIVGSDRAVLRSDDDGEPSGTTGAPMLEALSHTRMPSGQADLTDVAVVVVRWFGGTLLGAGGLVSAYSDSVVEALDQSRLEGLLHRRRRMRHLRLPAPIGVVGRWENDLRTDGVDVLGTEYTNDVAELHLAVDDTGEARKELEERVAAISSGQGTLTEHGIGWVEDAP